MDRLRQIAAIPLAAMATLSLVWLMKVLIDTRSVEEEFLPPPARIVFVSNDIEEVDNPEPPQPKQPPQPEEPDPKWDEEKVPPTPIQHELEQVELPLDLVGHLEVPPIKKIKPKPPKKPVKKKVVKSRVAKAKFDKRPLYRPKPHYPPAARRRGIEGYVTVKCTVTKSGGVSNVGVISARPRGIFETSALNAVRRWRFRPQPIDRPGQKSRIRFVLR